MFNGVSLSGSDNFLIQLGTSSSWIQTGYVSSSFSDTIDGGGIIPGVDTTTGFVLFDGGGTTNKQYGKFDINKFSDTSYTFTGQSRPGDTTGRQAYGVLNGLSGTITRLRITTVSNDGSQAGTDTFDDNNTGDYGLFNISYKTPGSANNEGTDAGQGFFENDTTLNSSKTLPANKNVGIFGPYTIGNNVTLTVPTGTTFTVV